jgi:hypothetical protein
LRQSRRTHSSARRSSSDEIFEHVTQSGTVNSQRDMMK